MLIKLIALIVDSALTNLAKSLARGAAKNNINIVQSVVNYMTRTFSQKTMYITFKKRCAWKVMAVSFTCKLIKLYSNSNLYAR